MVVGTKQPKRELLSVHRRQQARDPGVGDNKVRRKGGAQHHSSEVEHNTQETTIP